MLLEYIPIEEQDANILTKNFLRWKFEFQRGTIEVENNPFFAKSEC